jgi:hypothetical protein
MAKYYLPYPANTTSAVDNAKLAILLEGLLRVLHGSVGLSVCGETEVTGLREAVESGVKRREEKAAKGKGRHTREGEAGIRWMGACHRRLRHLLECADTKEDETSP